MSWWDEGMTQKQNKTAELQEIRTRIGLSVDAFAKAMGFKGGSSIQRYLDDDYPQRYYHLTLIERIAHAAVGKGDPPVTLQECYALGGYPTPPLGVETSLDFPLLPAGREDEPFGHIAHRETPKARKTLPSVTGIDDQFALLPVYDARAAAGFGCINDDNPEPLHFNAYRIDWLRRVTSAAASELAVIQVSGDSNWPTLHNGDHVLIDRTVNRYNRDGLYVIRYNHEDEIMVKRLSRDPRSRTLTVKSDNPDYPTFDGVKDDDLTVIGRVLWLGRNLG